LDGAAALLFVVEAEQTPQLFSSLTLNGIDLDSVEANLPEAVLRRAVQESTAQMISDVQRSSLLPKDRDLPYRSLIVVPVLRRGIVQELLCIIFEETRLFGLQDLNAVDLLAAQVSGHLENARLNEALHISYDRLRATINATRSAIILLDMNGIVQELNVVAEGLLGTIGRDIRQQPLASVIHQQHHDDESWQALLQQYQTAPEDVTGQEFIFLQDEKSLDFKASVFPVMGQDETLVGRLLVLRDISEEKDLQRYQYRIQRMIVHDLVGPLGAIITGLTFTKEVLETPQEGEDPAQIILPTVDVSLDSAGNLLHMVETLRDLPQSTNMTTFPTAVTTQSLVNRARDSLSSFLVSDSITFEYRPNGEVPPLYVDADLTRRVIINLLHNAFKFTPEGGTILIAAEQSSEQEGFLRLRVCDTGPGIPPDQRERIFQEYAQIEGRLPRAGGRGMGLGLHFCKLVVEAHGGEIGVDDGGLLSGACISFTLPIATEEQIKAAAKNEK
jgi:PAS domain S-box-containing protein